MDKELIEYLLESPEDELFLTEAKDKKKSKLKKMGRDTVDAATSAVFRLQAGSTLLTKAQQASVKRALRKKRDAMASESDRKKLIKVIDNNIKGLNKFMARNTKSFTEKREQKKIAIQKDFIKWMQDFKKEVQKVDVKSGTTVTTESGDAIFITTDIDLALEKLNEDDFFTEDVDVLLRDK